MPIDWTDKVRSAIINLETKSRVLEPDPALAIIDDVVEGKLAAYELAIIHGIPEAWIKVTLGHVTRMVQGTGRVRPLDAGGWYAFQGHEQPYKVAPGFAAGGQISSDGGVLLLAGVDKQLGLIDMLAAIIPDHRDPNLITHPMADILRPRVFAIACGCVAAPANEGDLCERLSAAEAADKVAVI